MGILASYSQLQSSYFSLKMMLVIRLSLGTLHSIFCPPMFEIVIVIYNHSLFPILKSVGGTLGFVGWMLTRFLWINLVMRLLKAVILTVGWDGHVSSMTFISQLINWTSVGCVADKMTFKINAVSFCGRVWWRKLLLFDMLTGVVIMCVKTQYWDLV